jgi:hypothetical protein
MSGELYDYEIEIPAEFAGRFRELLRVAVDALGSDEDDLIELGRDLLSQLS